MVEFSVGEATGPEVEGMELRVRSLEEERNGFQLLSSGLGSEGSLLSQEAEGGSNRSQEAEAGSKPFQETEAGLNLLQEAEAGLKPSQEAEAGSRVVSQEAEAGGKPSEEVGTGPRRSEDAQPLDSEENDQVGNLKRKREDGLPRVNGEDQEKTKEGKEATPAAARTPRYKKRKIAMFVSYCGAGYQGMQKNIGAKTIEGDLEEALFKAGAIAASTYGDPRKIDWARAARTDKGVSAVGQVVSGRFFIDPPGFVERVNAHLAKQIRVLGFKRTTGGFSAKKLCDRRRYEYVLPLFCLDPASHRCEVDIRSRPLESADPSEAAVPEEGKPFSCPCEETEYTFGDEERKKLNRVLAYYVGTHNFHNFTCRIKPEDPSTQRYMLSFEAGDVFTVDDRKFLRCTVVGQSFMLHQIRKMIGLAVAVMRGAPESIVQTAFRKDMKINVPMAPELGLFLDECLYTAYNQRYAGSHEEISLKDFERENAQFKSEVIYPHIASTDARDKVFARWLHVVTEDRYPDFALERQRHSTGSETV